MEKQYTAMDTKAGIIRVVVEEEASDQEACKATAMSEVECWTCHTFEVVDVADTCLND